jgi:hypothetical protein
MEEAPEVLALQVMVALPVQGGLGVMVATQAVELLDFVIMDV